MTNQNCLERGQLKEYLAGWVDEQQSLAIEAHLADCEVCEQTVSGLETDPDTLVQHMRGGDEVSEGNPKSGEHESSILLDALKAIGKRVGLADRSEPTVEVPSELGVYQLTKPLGSGGMGAVYLATHRQLGKTVALKLLPNQTFHHPHHAARFQREMKAAGGLEHDSIVRATDAGEVAGVHFLAMEYIDGLDLSKILRSQSQLAIADACEVIRQVASGLAHAHAEGIVHRDIKPSNLMLNREGQVKILDFGLARIGPWDEVSAELTTVGQLMGTIDYMAPEQAERAEAVDYRADLFSLGATFYKLLTGRSPLAVAPGMSPLAKLRLLSTFEAPDIAATRSDVPGELSKLISLMLDSDPNKRPASASLIANRLSSFAEGSQLRELVAKSASLGPEISQQSVLSELQVSPLVDGRVSKDDGKKSRSWFGWALAILFVPMLVAAGVLFTLELQKGQLVIDSDAAVRVELRQDGETVKQVQVVPGGTATKLYAGRYQVIIEGGSDSLSIGDDGWITIEKGDTRLARIMQKPPGAQPGIVRDDAVLRPGQAIRLESFTMPELKRIASVTADEKIRLPLVGSVSVAGDNLDSLQKKLEEQYAVYVKDPSIELYHVDVTVPSGAPQGMVKTAEAMRIPPASTAALQPGDRLELVFYQSSDLNRVVVVQADLNVRLPLIGTVSVDGLTLDAFVSELEKQYAKSGYIRDPQIDVFRAGVAKNLNEIASGPSEAEKTSKLLQPVYEGKELDDYLATLRYERSDEAIRSALGAITALSTKESNPRITAELRRILPEIGWSSWDNYYYAIMLLRGVDPSCDSWFLEQLSGETDMRWRKPLIKNCLSEQTELVTAMKMIDVISQSDLAQQTEATLEARNLLHTLLLNRDGKLQRQAFTALKYAPEVDDEFWLNLEALIGDSRVTTDANRNKIVRIYFAGLGELESEVVDFIVSRATQGIQTIELHDQKILQVYEALHILMQNESKSLVRASFTRHAAIAAIEQRLQRILKQKSGALKPLAVDNKRYRLQPHIDRMAPSEASEWTVELLAAARLPQFSEVSEATRLEIAKFFLVKAAECNGEYRAQDPWAKGGSRTWGGQSSATHFYSRVESRLIPHSQRAAYLIFGECFTRTAYDAKKELLQRYLDRVRATYLARSFRGISSDSEDAIGAASLSALFGQIGLAEAGMDEIDSNGDGRASLAELEAYRKRADSPLGQTAAEEKQAKSSPPRESMDEAVKYAEALIKKYDRDADGKLSEAEWKKMLIKPKGADANGDGFIEAEEYAKFRLSR